MLHGAIEIISVNAKHYLSRLPIFLLIDENS